MTRASGVGTGTLGSAPHWVTDPDAPLHHRYAPGAIAVLEPEERRRLLDAAGAPRNPDVLSWELLYRIEPDLYARLVAGERLHEGILEWLPEECGDVLEVGAGSGRLTTVLAARSRTVVAVEPAAPLREILASRAATAGLDNVRVCAGRFEELPAGEHDLVVACSAFAACGLEDPAACLAALERACRPGGMVALIWPRPEDLALLAGAGYAHLVFAGPMVIEYRSADDAAWLARVFHPDRAAAVAACGSRFVDYATLGVPAPRNLCWKRVRRAP